MDPSVIVVEPDAWRAQPWRNGAGVTHELVRWPDADAYRVRISVADVTAPAPFSPFPGIDRWLWLLAGGPVELAIAGASHVLAGPGDGVAFAGEAAAAATCVVTASRDLNVMIARGQRARVELVHGPAERTLAGAFAAAFVLDGEVDVAPVGRLARHACAIAYSGLPISLAVMSSASAVTVVVD